MSVDADRTAEALAVEDEVMLHQVSRAVIKIIRVTETLQHHTAELEAELAQAQLRVTELTAEREGLAQLRWEAGNYDEDKPLDERFCDVAAEGSRIFHRLTIELAQARRDAQRLHDHSLDVEDRLAELRERRCETCTHWVATTAKDGHGQCYYDNDAGEVFWQEYDRHSGAIFTLPSHCCNAWLRRPDAQRTEGADRDSAGSDLPQKQEGGSVMGEQLQAAHRYLSKAVLPDRLPVYLPDGSTIYLDLTVPAIRGLVATLATASIAMSDRGGIGSDEVRRIARSIKAMREKT